MRGRSLDSRQLDHIRAPLHTVNAELDRAGLIPRIGGKSHGLSRPYMGPAATLFFFGGATGCCWAATRNGLAFGSPGLMR